MKNIFRSSHATDLSLLLARVGIGALMLTHGLPKLAMIFSGQPVQFPGVFGLSAEFSLGLAVFAEVICSILVIIGLGTRLVVVPLIITMAVAAFYVHATDGFARQEPALQYMLVYIVLFFAGGGRYSIDHLLQRRSVYTYSRVERRKLAEG